MVTPVTEEELQNNWRKIESIVEKNRDKRVEKELNSRSLDWHGAPCWAGPELELLAWEIYNLSYISSRKYCLEV